jgi:hypothetical protein
MNCGVPVGADAKLFAEVLVCPTCHAIATRVLERGHAILRRISVLLRDTIQYALKRGKLEFARVDAEVVSDADLLRRIVGLYTERHDPCPTPQTSSKSSELSALSAPSK